MWTVNAPTHTVKVSFGLCTSKIKKPSLKAKFASIAADIEAAELTYKIEASNANLCVIPSHGTVKNVISKAEMVKLYDNSFVPKPGPGRVIYDFLLSLPKHSRCPFCGHRPVSTLDHILAKTTHPSLAVTPLNLVACCADCNKLKGNKIITTNSEQYLHPYFDEVESEVWLICDVVSSPHYHIKFSVSAPASWDLTTNQRVKNQFATLELNKLYVNEAASEMDAIRYRLEMLLNDIGPPAVQKHLEECYISAEQDRKNSWRTALYKGLHRSMWFCSGGFLSL